MFVARKSLGILIRCMSGKQEIESIIRAKEKTEEDIYYGRKDREVMRKIRDNLDRPIPADKNDPEVIQRHREELIRIIRKHNLRPSEAFVNDILYWKDEL